MDVRVRPEWLKGAENRSFEMKARHVSYSAEQEDEAKLDDDVDLMSAVSVVVDTPKHEPPDQQHSQMEQFETLKRKQQQQMKELLLQQTEVIFVSRMNHHHHHHGTTTITTSYSPDERRSTVAHSQHCPAAR